MVTSYTVDGIVYVKLIMLTVAMEEAHSNLISKIWEHGLTGMLYIFIKPNDNKVYGEYVV